jgi:proteasome accessory factor B
VPEKIAPEERLLSLTVALMAHRYGLTKEQILSSVSGYREARAEGRSSDALEKMFERDKDALRDLGVPIHTVGDHADPDDLREARYLIPKAEYLLPADITFTPAEVAVLNVAAAVWGESSMSADASAALRKIRALGIDVDEPIIGFAPRISARDPAFAPLRQANDQARVVRFTYVKPGDDVPRLRTVEPHALIEFEGRWHVHGLDRDLSQTRTFLLSRIVGDVVVTKEGFDPEVRVGAGERARLGLEEVSAHNVAQLRVQDATEAAVRLRRRGTRDGDVLHVRFVDIHVLADELASYGPEVLVEEPPALRAEVIARLERTLEAHGVRA